MSGSAYVLRRQLSPFGLGMGFKSIKELDKGLRIIWMAKVELYGRAIDMIDKDTAIGIGFQRFDLPVDQVQPFLSIEISFVNVFK